MSEPGSVAVSLPLPPCVCGKDLRKYLSKWNAKSLTTFGCCLSVFEVRVRCLPAVCLSVCFLGTTNIHREREREGGGREDTHTQVESIVRRSFTRVAFAVDRQGDRAS